MVTASAELGAQSAEGGSGAFNKKGSLPTSALRAPRSALVLMLFLAVPCIAAMQEDSPGSVPPAAKVTHSGPNFFRDVEAYAGPSILKGELGVGLGVRKPVCQRWVAEWGGVLPHPVSGFAEDAATDTSNPPL